MTTYGSCRCHGWVGTKADHEETARSGHHPACGEHPGAPTLRDAHPPAYPNTVRDGRRAGGARNRVRVRAYSRRTKGGAIAVGAHVRNHSVGARGPGWSYFGRDAATGKVVRLTAARAAVLCAVPKETDVGKWNDGDGAISVVWEVPPKYKKEARWRVEHRWIAPSWAREHGPMAGGVRRDDGSVEEF